MAPIGPIGQYTPSVVKSCHRCRSRKVKCDMKIPQCSACEKQGEQCNITDYVAYPYALVESLHLRVQALEEKLGTLPDQPGSSLQPQRNVSNVPWSEDISKEAEEVGILAIGLSDRYSQTKYVGAAAGSTFARIFFKQVGLEASQGPAESFCNSEDDISSPRAALPPQVIAKSLLTLYIARVHVWWPFLHLQTLRLVFQRIYERPRECQDYEKFITFIVMALASTEAHDDEGYISLMDLNSPQEYFQTSLHFFYRFGENSRDLKSLQAVLLLSLWMLNSSHPSHSNDLWHLTRYAMSVAIELGLHRHNVSWNFSQDELENRSRTWWTIYSLERLVALNTGRVLSVRDQAIDIPIPSTNSADVLTAQEAKSAVTFNAKSVWVFAHMIELRKIAGRVLESIYIARSQNGRSSLTFQEICSISNELHQRLDQWKIQLDAAEFEPSREYRCMKIEYCILLLHLNRPSPAFMIPSLSMVAVSSHAASSCLHQWHALSTEFGIKAICKCYRHFHDILMVGLARLYCDWHTQRLVPDTSASIRPDDAALCQDILEKCLSTIQDSSLKRFLRLFSLLRSKTYSSNTAPGIHGEMHPSQIVDPATFVNIDNQLNSLTPVLDLNSYSEPLATGADGLENYLNQVSDVFDSEMIDVDDMLTAWYGSILDDVGGGDHL